MDLELMRLLYSAVEMFSAGVVVRAYVDGRFVAYGVHPQAMVGFDG
jgi:hypothetical protein